jgi:hypothetical protein
LKTKRKLLDVKIRELLSDVYGDFITELEHEYEDKIVTLLMTEEYYKKEEWVTYNQLMFELKHSLKNELKVKELQYRLTDNENPKYVCIKIMEGLEDKSPEMLRLYEKIKTFL